MLMYKLVNRRAIPCPDPFEWTAWFSSTDRRVAETQIDDVRISTIFLGFFYPPPDPVDPCLFETVVFVGDLPHYGRRYFIWEEAEIGHAEILHLMRSEIAKTGLAAPRAWAAVAKRLNLERLHPMLHYGNFGVSL